MKKNEEKKEEKETKIEETNNKEKKHLKRHLKKSVKYAIILVITLIVVSVLLVLGFKNQDKIYRYYQNNILHVREGITINKNDYYKKQDYKYVQNTNDFVAKDKNHLKNILYTIVNSGTANFTFYCDENYKNCNKDIVEFVKDKDKLSSINNFVHPYNSFESLSAHYDKFGKVNVKVKRLYSEEEISETNKVVDEIIKKNINDKMSDKKKIKTIHNYIIKNGKYATDNYRKKHKDKKFNKALDILKDKYGLCSAYSDAMAIFLNKFGIDNYKITSESHIWNLVNIDKKWLHLDLTWDDPITSNGKDKLEDMFLLIDNKKLKELKVKKHDYNKEIFEEAK